MLAVGALVGLVAGLVTLFLLRDHDSLSREDWSLVPLAMLLPSLVFVGWWLLVPGLAVDRDETHPVGDAERAASIDARIARIEAAFSDPMVPRPRRALEVDPGVGAQLRGSVGTDAAIAANVDRASFGLSGRSKRAASPEDAPLDAVEEA